MLINERNASSIYQWETNGSLNLYHQTQANDVDYNPSQGSSAVWIAEHFSDDFKEITPGSGTGFDNSYNTPYAYPKHLTVYNNELLVMSRNTTDVYRYDFNGNQLSLFDVGGVAGQGMATDGTNLFISVWDGNNSVFQEFDSSFNLLNNYINPVGLGVNNIFDFAFDTDTYSFFGLGTNGEGGTGTNSSTIFEFEMGGNLLNTFNLNISADGIGQFGQSNTLIPEPKTLAIFALGIFLLSSLKRRAMVK